MGELTIFCEMRKILKECVEAETYCIDFSTASHANVGFVDFFLKFWVFIAQGHSPFKNSRKS